MVQYYQIIIIYIVTGFLEHVTVLIGISVNEKPVAGVIHQPYYKTQIGGEKKLGRTIWGLQEAGIGGFTPAPPPDSLVITTTRSHSNPLVEKALQVMNANQILRVGGAGYKVGYFYIKIKTKCLYYKCESLFVHLPYCHSAQLIGVIFNVYSN